MNIIAFMCFGDRLLTANQEGHLDVVKCLQEGLSSVFHYIHT